MKDSALAAAMERARKLVADQKMTHRGINDDNMSSEQEDDSDEEAGGSEGEELWSLLPHLKGISAKTLRKLPTSALFHLNSARAKESKNSAKLSINARMADNAQKLMKNPAYVSEGLDNRKTTIHESRFLGGLSCPLTEVWSSARKHIDAKGITPLGNYDLDSVGCGGCVTPKGWFEIHNPASQELKLKLFHLPNVASNSLSTKKLSVDGSDETFCIGDSLREISDMEGFKTALNTAREALHSALPWNRSISAVVGFMLNTNYLQADLQSNQKRAAILTEFVDFVFGRNALNWENAHPFITTDELPHVWANWKAKRSVMFTKKSEEQKGQGAKGESKKRMPNDICRKFNVKVCADQAGKDCKSPMGKILRHVCNRFIGKDKMCEKDHARMDHP